jgi:hypothetical protein
MKLLQYSKGNKCFSAFRKPCQMRSVIKYIMIRCLQSASKLFVDCHGFSSVE